TAAERPGSADLGEFRSLVDRMNNRQRVELETEMTQLQGNLARLGRESSVDGRDLAATRALVDNLRQSQGVRLKEQSEALQEAIAGLDRMRQPSPAIAGGDEQHLRFAGMVGNTNVEVRGLSSVDVSYDNETGELLIRTMDSIIRVKAPKR
ncbi:MAG: hypothetical protein ABI836_12430, partial [Gemmatimonadota bacterium]